MPTPQPIRESNERLIVLALRKAGQLMCCHSFLLQQHRERLFLRCCHCGAESRGFRVEDRVSHRLRRHA